MSKYEIMILVNPTSTEESVKELLFSVLDEANTKFERLERTELAYPIKKLSRANYFLVTTKTSAEAVKELTRKFNIDKSILRFLIINLDSEKGLKPRKQKRFAQRNFDNKKTHNRQRQGDTAEGRQDYIRRPKPEVKTEAKAEETKE